MVSGALLVWRCRTLGDVVLSQPALAALRHSDPDFLWVAGYPAAWEPARHLIDEVLPIEEPPTSHLLAGHPSPELRTWLRDVGHAVAVTTRDVRSVLEGSGVPRVTQILPVPPPGRHMADWLRDAVTEEPGTAGPTLALSSRELAEAGAFLRRLGVERPLVIHPGSAESWKRWPVKRFARLADVLQAQGYQVVLVAGPADAALLFELQRLRCYVSPVVRLPARRLAAVLARARLFIGNDSGVTHLAAAAGAPVVALFGPTDPGAWAPRGRVRVVRACTARAEDTGQIRVCFDPQCLAHLTLGEVLAAARAELQGAVPAQPAADPPANEPRGVAAGSRP